MFILNIKDDSRKIKKGDTFIAIDNGKNYIIDAINNGASKVIVEEGLYHVETLTVSNTHEYLINYLSNYKFNFKLIGITGTNGKTTSCYLIYQMLNKLGYKCAYIGTIGFYKDKFVRNLNNTTPDVLELYEMLLECSDYDYVVMEVSSHALDKKRIGKLLYDYTVFTNLTRDHLDYHKTFENYLFSKQKLFKSLKEDGIGIINSDDSFKNYFMDCNHITYGLDSNDFKIIDYSFDLNGTNFSIKYLDNIYDFNTKLIGKYNIYNALVSIIIGFMENIPYDKIKNVLKELEEPKGRMQKLKLGNNLIIIDYAHTPDALMNVINTVGELKHNRIITLIGCGGNRDKSKRPIMGDIATKYSSYVIFTNDNPRDEDEMDIINDIIDGVKSNNYLIEKDREKAIIKGLNMLLEEDILLILGKGHEEYQIIKDKKIEFSDYKVVLNYLKNI